MAGNPASFAVERRGLYYPWVHFVSDEWVKKALLVFPGLFRMVSDRQDPYDTALILQLRESGLIRHADLNTPNALEAQLRLQTLIEEDLQADRTAFLARYGKEQAARSGQPSFQMHLAKTSVELELFLKGHGLAWTPTHPDQAAYSELHPDLGQAVMGTIAVACAEDAGLHIVGVESSRGRDVSAELNNTLAASDKDGAYQKFVRKQHLPSAVQPGADELFQFLVSINCDVSGLDAAALLKLQDEREPLRALKRRVQELALEIPPMRDPAERNAAFQDRANDIVKAWQQDRVNLSRYAREILPLDAFAGGARQFMTVMQDKLVPIAAGAIGSTLSATAGLAIGLLTHLGTSYGKLKKIEADSPFRYMTLAESQGVAFSVSQAVART